MNKVRKAAPKDWESYFQAANVRVQELTECKSSRAKSIKMGLFLSPQVGREVPIQVRGRACNTETMEAR